VSGLVKEGGEAKQWQVHTGRPGMLIEDRELVRESDETYERRALSTIVSSIAISASFTR